MNKFKNIIKKVSILFTFLFTLLLIGKVNDIKIEKTPEENNIDVLIIGSGPAGLSAATHSSRARLNTLIIEGDNPGGQLMGTTLIENFPGFPSDILGPDLIKKLRLQAKQFGSNFLTDSVKKIDFSSIPYKVSTTKGATFFAKTIIIATGVSSSDLGIKGEIEYSTKGISHCAISQGPDYKDKDIVIVGGGDSAIEDAIILSSYAKNITLLVRSNKMRAIQSSQDKLKNLANVSILYNTNVKEIIGDGTKVTAVTLKDNTNNNTYDLATSGVFLAIGNEPNINFLNNNIEMDEKGYITTKGATQETSLSGVFAAGDVVSNKTPLAAVAAGSGTQAGFEAVKFLANYEPEQKGNKIEPKSDYVVCFCKGVLYSEIVQAVKEGCSTFQALHEKLGICSGCRSCRGKIESILKEELEK